MRNALEGQWLRGLSGIESLHLKISRISLRMDTSFAKTVQAAIPLFSLEQTSSWFFLHGK